MDRLLVATDLSTRSAPAVRRAKFLCRQFSPELHVLHVVDDDQPAAMVELECRQAEEALAREAGELKDAAGVAPHLSVRTGDPFQSITHYADELNADLILMGAHRKRILLDVFVGTTVERVMRTGNRPVLMVNRLPAGPYGRVLVATDMSPASRNALRAAGALGMLEKAHVTLLHVFQYAAKITLIQANLPSREIEAQVAREAADARRSLVNFLSGLGLDTTQFHIRLEEGEAIARIVAAAETDRPYLEVIGTRGLTGVKRLLLGSVADALLRRLECDVLAVGPTSSP